MIKWLQFIFHFHKWIILAIYNDPQRQELFSDGQSRMVSYWALRCSICGKIKHKTHGGHFTLSESSSDDELTALKKIAGLK